MKGSEIASHHGGGGVVTKFLEISSDPVRIKKGLEIPWTLKMHSAIPMCPPEYM